MVSIFAEFDGPLFEVGTRVFVRNPNSMWIDDESEKTYVISDVFYVKESDQYVYKLDGLTLWYNEAWIEPDVFGPMTINVDAAQESRERAEQVDNLLDIASWNRKMYAKTGDESYNDRLFVTEAELKKLTEAE
jgi:hypothetical protein